MWQTLLARQRPLLRRQQQQSLLARCGGVGNHHHRPLHNKTNCPPADAAVSTHQPLRRRKSTAAADDAPSARRQRRRWVPSVVPRTTSRDHSTLLPPHPEPRVTLLPWTQCAAGAHHPTETEEEEMMTEMRYDDETTAADDNRQAVLVLTKTLLRSQRIVRESRPDTTGTVVVSREVSGATMPTTTQDNVVRERSVQSQSGDEADLAEDTTTTGLVSQYVANSFAPIQHIRPDPVATAAQQLEEGIDDYHPENPDTAMVERTVARFESLVGQQKVLMANKLFWFAKRQGFADRLNAELLHKVFYMLLKKRKPLFALHVMEQCLTNYRDDPDIPQEDYQRRVYTSYASLAYALRYVDPTKNKPWVIEELGRGVLDSVKRFDEEGRAKCLPILLSSLLQQRIVSLGRMARNVYEHMLEMEMDLPPGYMEHLLTTSRYNRQRDLPFAEILLSTVFRGRRPYPPTVVRAVENMFPFTNMEDTRMALQALVELQSQPDENSTTAEVVYPKEYILDTAVLETVSASIARTGDTNAIQLLWEYMDASNLDPAVGVYECTAVTFCHRADTYRNALAVMEEMQVRGHPPSRALIRSMSYFLRADRDKVEKMLNLVLEDIEAWLMAQSRGDVAAENGHSPFPLGALNLVLSAMAERGDLDQSIKLMNLIDEEKLPVDDETFSYAFEVLGKHIAFRSKRTRDKKQLRAYVLGRAMDYLTMMDARNIALSNDIIRQYVEVLCNANECQTATQVVLDALKCGPVMNKIIYRIAMANAHEGNFEMAKHLAGKGTESMPFLLNRIHRVEEGDDVDPGERQEV